MKLLLVGILSLSLTFGTLIGCGNDGEKVVTPVSVENAPSAPQLEMNEDNYVIGRTMTVEGVPNGQSPVNDRIVYLSAFGNENWVIYLKEDERANWPRYDELINVEGVYLGDTDLNTGTRSFEILIDAEVTD